MPHDQVVTPRHLLDAQLQFDRSSNGRFLKDLEHREPELANYLMESLSQFYSRLTALGGPARRTQQVYQRIESCILICLCAQRSAHRELWDTDLPAETGAQSGSPAAQNATAILPAATPSAEPPIVVIPPDGYQRSITTTCPLCGSQHHTVAEPQVVESSFCISVLRCHDCGNIWSLVTTRSDRRPLPVNLPP